MSQGWTNAVPVQGEEWAYICGYCGNRVAPAGVYGRSSSQDNIRICIVCGQPTYFRGNAEQIPNAAFGGDVDALPPLIEQLYREARDCIAVPAYTASVLLCRKLLMHLGVELGAPEAGSFVSYVEYLADNNYVLQTHGDGLITSARKATKRTMRSS